MKFGLSFFKRSTLTTPAITLSLSKQQDGFGFYYGTALSSAGESWNINVMPPKRHWRGDFPLEGYEPHPTDWVIYIGDEEVARATERGDLVEAMAHTLLLEHDNPLRRP